MADETYRGATPKTKNGGGLPMFNSMVFAIKYIVVGSEVGYGPGEIMITSTGLSISVGNIKILLILIKIIHNKILFGTGSGR